MSVVAVHSFTHYTLQVPDLSAAEVFYTAVGVNVRREAGKLVLSGTDGRVGGVVIEGEGRRVHHLSFTCFPDDLAKIRAAALRQGVEPVPAPSGFSADGLWLTDPDGMLVEIVAGERTAPIDKRLPVFKTIPAGVRGTPSHADAVQTRPTRFSHMARFTKDLDATLAFYEGVLGLRVADRSGRLVVFMYSPHGSDHHILAFAGTGAAGLHHLTWEFATVDEIGQAATHMVANGYKESWGLGRHVIGANYFHYFRDPWGSLIEFTCDMDYIPADVEWSPIDYPTEDALYFWGPEPPANVLTNSELPAQ